MIICDLNLNRHISDGKITLHYSIKAPQEMKYSPLIEELKTSGELKEFSVTE